MLRSRTMREHKTNNHAYACCSNQIQHSQPPPLQQPQLTIARPIRSASARVDATACDLRSKLSRVEEAGYRSCGVREMGAAEGSEEKKIKTRENVRLARRGCAGGTRC